ncbi:MAG: UDP-N-acetylmuramate dehydrogenase [Butyrivibrio sp.]|nr:UDP-N-acetylmuramate dehydrogenase [Butyrivibrio sp.]
MNSEITEALKKFIPEENILENEPMSRHTMFRVGGPADCFVRVTEKNQLIQALCLLKEAGQNFFILGNGSNLLVSDAGYRGVVLCTAGGMNRISVEDTVIYAEAGASNAAIAAAAKAHALTGFEFAAGIPGTIGGGMVMNAGAYGSEMVNVTEKVEALRADGTVCRFSCEEMKFGYRSSIIRGSHMVVLSVQLHLQHGDSREIGAKMEELAAKRMEKQPLEYPSAGSTFKRPEGYFAGKLIMDAGLKGFTVGGAQVSEKHCGFIINRGGATAADLHHVIDQVQESVFTQFGVKLEPEVIMLGEFDGTEKLQESRNGS